MNTSSVSVSVDRGTRNERPATSSPRFVAWCVLCSVGINMVGILETVGRSQQLSFDPVALTQDTTRLIASEDFTREDSLSQFRFADPAHWQRVQVGDRYAAEHSDASAGSYQPQHRSPWNIAIVAAHRVGSCVLECDVQQTGKEYGHRDACFFFGFRDPTHYYYVHIATQSDEHAHQIFTVNDAPRTRITLEGTPGFDWGPTDRWHRVRVVRDLPTGWILVYIDDMAHPVMKAQDTTHGPGYVGFGSFDDVGRVTRVRVYSPDAVSERANFFAEK